MGLFSEVLQMAGTTSAQRPEHETALNAILNYINSPQVGGIAGLTQKFQQVGLGPLMESWIGNGPNPPITRNQLQNVLHDAAFQRAAHQSGIDPARLTSLMSLLLPHLIDKLTDSGQVPDAATLQQMLKAQAASG